jgi:hypothetical protein
MQMVCFPKILPTKEIFGWIWYKISESTGGVLFLVGFDFDLFFFIGSDGGSSCRSFDLVDGHDDFFLCVSDQGIDESSIESGEEVSQEAVVELAGSVELFELRGIEIEDS